MHRSIGRLSTVEENLDNSGGYHEVIHKPGSFARIALKGSMILCYSGLWRWACPSISGAARPRTAGGRPC